MYPATSGTHSYSVSGTHGFIDVLPPTFVDADAIPVVRGTPLLIAAEPPTLAISASEGLAVGGPTVELGEPDATFDLPVGSYLVAVDAEWDNAAARFWLPIQIVSDDAAAPTPPGTTVLDRDGVVVTYPAGWAPAAESLTPRLTDPHELLALGTYPLVPGGSRCAQFPELAIEDLGPTDGLIWLAERQPVSPSTEQRPADLDAWLRTQPSDISSDCLSEPKDFVHHYGEFTDAGRSFALYVAYGAEVSADTIASCGTS